MRKSVAITSLLRPILVVGAIVAAVALLGLGAAATAPAHAGTNDFSYDSWHVDYALDLDDSGRATARVTETVSPRFPDTDQNRGIVRGIPTSYQGVDTDPREILVTTDSGEPVPFSVDDEDDFRIIAVGDDTFVHGLQTYVISYTISDVVLQRDDGTADEFYWDVMDFEHLQPVAEFSASLTVSPALDSALNGNTHCYVGEARSTTSCDLQGSGTSAEPLTLAPTPLAPKEGVTLAVGLHQGAVEIPAQRLPNFALDGLPFIVGGVGAAAAAAGTVSVQRMKARRRTARGVVVAQYDVPSSLPPLIAAPIYGAGAKDAAAAEIIHLAVSGAIRLEDGVTEGGLLSRPKPTQSVRVVDPSRAADPLDQLALEALVPDAHPDATRQLPKEDESFATAMTGLTTAGAEHARDRGYFEKQRAPRARMYGFTALAVSAACFVLGILGFVYRSSPLPVVFVFAGFGIAALALFVLARHTVHTPLGAQTREYLEGVKLFIEVAEADRIKTLQAASTAERIEVNGIEVVHLYERLLPYAMLFGLEREWTAALEARYRAHPGYVPYWYPGVAMNGLANFGTTLSSYTSFVTNSVSYTSSSAGGSTGGGFAGGGGGGGFSGGR